MTFSERNDLIDDMLCKFKVLHDKFTSSTKILEDAEWKEYINSMDAVCEKHKGTNLETIVWKLCQAFLDDTEVVQKKLRGSKS